MATIDADAHVLETERTWDYMEPSEREFKPRIVSVSRPDGARDEYWFAGGRLQLKSGNVGRDAPRAAREMEDMEARLRHMDELGVDIQVLYPTIFLRPITHRPEVELALCRSYNRWLTDIWKQGKGRLRWVAVLPVLSMERALEEMKVAKENGACGVFMRGLEDEKRLSDPYFFPLYQRASDLDMPVCVHSGTGHFGIHDFFDQEPGFCKFKLAVVGAFHSIVFNGVPQLFPKLRWGFIEVSAQWVPYLIHDLARRFQRRGKSLPKDLLRDLRLYVACQTDDDLSYVLQYAGEDNLVIGSDYGHADTSSEIEALRRLKERSEFNPAVINKILDDNARALYSL